MSRIGCPPTHTKLVRFYPLRIAAARTHACIRLREPPAPVSLFLFVVCLLFHLPVFSFLTLRWPSSYFFLFSFYLYFTFSVASFSSSYALLISFPRSLFSFESFSFIIFLLLIFSRSSEKRKKEEKVECRKSRVGESEMKQK